MRKPLIAGNWKMFKSKREVLSFAGELKGFYKPTEVETAICAPFIYLETLKTAFRAMPVKIGAQNAYFEEEGPFTGEISVKMLEEIGVDYCIIGHSERRLFFGETDENVNKKLLRMFQGSISPIVCFGETLEQRDSEQQFMVVSEQMLKSLAGITPQMAARLTIAYEPVWAIGTGRTASPIQAEEMCEFIRNGLVAIIGEAATEQVRILYGGSVKPKNAADIMSMSNIDGALVGGASLKAKDFMEIVNF